MEKNTNFDTADRKHLLAAQIEVIRFEAGDVIATSDDGGGGLFCLAKGTKLTMADGSLRNIEAVQVGDLVKAFDHETGCFTNQEVYFIFKGDAPRQTFTLHFSDGNTLSIVGIHDLFEKESRRYVRIGRDNADSFVGKHFYHADSECYVTLSCVTYETEKTDFYCVFTKYTINCVANGMLNIADTSDCWVNIYKFGEDLRADQQALAEDIEKYGIYEFHDSMAYSRQEYDYLRVRYKDIAIGKGLVTQDELVRLYNAYYQKNLSAQ